MSGQGREVGPGPEEEGLSGPALVPVGFEPEFVESDKLVLMGEEKGVGHMDRRAALVSWE